MARIRVPFFVGSSNVLASLTASAQDAVNLYPTTTAPDGSRVEQYDRGTPGYRPWLTLPTSPVKWEFQQDQRAWAIAGDTLYEVFANAAYVARGTMAENDYLPSGVSNGTAGNQMLFTSGDVAYVLDLTTDAFGAVADLSGYATRMCEFVDGYGIVLHTESREFRISAPEDFTSWDPLDFAQRQMASDNIATIIRLGRVLMLLGTKTSEDWYNNGDVLFPFAPTQQTLVEHGGLAPFTARRFGDTVVWVGQDEDGQGMVYKRDGVTPTPIGTDAINTIIQNAGNPPNNDLRLASAWTYQQAGHEFYNLQLPVCDWMLSYDRIMNRWHKRAAWDSNNYIDLKDRGLCHMHAFGKHLVGDRLSGTIYEMDLGIYDAELTDV